MLEEMAQSEADMQRVWKHYVEAKWNYGTAVFELKRTHTYRLSVSAIRPHQLESLRQARNGKQYYKIPDDSAGIKPYDAFVMHNVRAFLVIGFGPKLIDFVCIPIDIWDMKNPKTSVTLNEVVEWPGVIVVEVAKQ